MARDIMEAFQLPFAKNGVPAPDPRSFPGTESIVGLERTLAALALWMKEHL